MQIPSVRHTIRTLCVTRLAPHHPSTNTTSSPVRTASRGVPHHQHHSVAHNDGPVEPLTCRTQPACANQHPVSRSSVRHADRNGHAHPTGTFWVKGRRVIATHRHHKPRYLAIITDSSLPRCWSCYEPGLPNPKQRFGTERIQLGAREARSLFDKRGCSCTYIGASYECPSD